ncbi:hypothetical protein G6F50_016532 [Rhizopus delemar]|uniref:Uncharacterized protein n=1 Tax=Rhizopus delemar TaxID=936053 RepID=A0A9P6XST3_9FUNG|nr:hypothetical protein G6F50_016532 [Rhizopus delemar]
MGGEGARLVGGPVVQAQAGGAGVGQGTGDGLAGAAQTGEVDVAAGGVMPLAAQTGHKAQAVEVAAGQHAVLQAHGIDRADQLGCRGQGVAQGGGMFLVGHRDHDAAQVGQAAQAGEQAGQRVGGHCCR